jgi:uncharacterized repeat protein (TIGR04076 family)
MSFLIEVFKDLTEKGLEFTTVHKLLHMVSKFIFLISFILLIQSAIALLRFLGISISITLATPSNIYSSSFTALILLLISIGLSWHRKASFSRTLFEYLTSTNIDDFRRYLPCKKGFDLFTVKEVTVRSAVRVFYNKIAEALYREKPWRILVRMVKIKPIVALFIMIFVENLILLLATYVALNVLPIGFDELIWLPLPNLNPLFKVVLEALIFLASAFILEYLNISTVIPGTPKEGEDKTKESEKEIITAPLYITLYVILLKMGQPIRIALSWKEKAIFTLILLLISSPWDPLIPTWESKDITSPKPIKVAFIFIPSPNTLTENNKNDVISNVFQEVCGKAFEKLGIVRTGRPCIAVLHIDKKGNKGDNILKQEIVEATRVALESLRASFTQLLGDWIVEFVDFSKLRNVIKKDKDYAEVIKKLFTEYSITLNAKETSSEGLQKLLRLYCDKEMLENLGELAQNFTLIIPVIAIARSHYHSDLGIILRAPIRILIPQPIYIAIPVLIALNPWTEPEKMSRFRELLEGKVMSSAYRVRVCVKEVRGNCAMGYRPGDCFVVERFYISEVRKGICIHALSSMLTLLSPFLKGVSAKVLGIGEQDDVGYVQCPDPGKPYTCGGTVVFELRRERIE